ncbi:MAG: c-type cytochrome, partial [Chitinophagaceae bacterium]
MKKSFLIILCLTALITFSFSFTDKPPRFKNIKVLPKDINKTELDSVMKSFTVALGVKCNFCHVRLDDEQKNWDFPSDANEHKGIAREMIEMTNKINKKYFDVRDSKSLTADLEVNCFTCHNGKAHPAKFPS